MKKKDWKKMFLSSGLPLEFELMKFFNSKPNPYRIEPDYSYFRKHLNETKEFSIDLSARYQMESMGGINSIDINYLIECKYRSAEKTWIFVPEIDRFPYGDGHQLPISSISCFDKQEISINHHLRQFSKNIEQAYKAIEYHKHTNEFIESTVSKGKNQLIYAIPNYIYESSDWYFDLIHDYWNDLNFVQVELICPILVTNAELRILNNEISIETIESANDINELSKPIDFVCLSTLNSREFKEYCNEIKYNSIKNELKRISEVENEEEEKEFIETILDQLTLEMNSDSIIVCNIKAFEELTLMIENLAESIASVKSQVKKEQRNST